MGLEPTEELVGHVLEGRFDPAQRHDADERAHTLPVGTGCTFTLDLSGGA